MDPITGALLIWLVVVTALKFRRQYQFCVYTIATQHQGESRKVYDTLEQKGINDVLICFDGDSVGVICKVRDEVQVIFMQQYIEQLFPEMQVTHGEMLEQRPDFPCPKVV